MLNLSYFQRKNKLLDQIRLLDFRYLCFIIVTFKVNNCILHCSHVISINLNLLAGIRGLYNCSRLYEGTSWAIETTKVSYQVFGLILGGSGILARMSLSLRLRF